MQTTLMYFLKKEGIVTQPLFIKGSSFSSKKLAILDLKLAQIAHFYPQKRAQKRVKGVSIITCHLCIRFYFILKCSSKFNKTHFRHFI